jgi:PTH1 family peptidyl-tRNA hydrolase
MKVIIGLGNPGKQYEHTRHNVGFMMVDKLKENYNFPDFEFNKKFNADISTMSLRAERSNLELNIDNLDSTGLPRRFADETPRNDKMVILAKPQTFMNNSGQSVRAILDFYKLKPEDIIVIHDDIDLPLGEYKIATSSGSAGHNGVQDIIDHIGTKEFQRVRIGIATENLRTQIEPADFVLQKFSEEELEKMEYIAGKILEEIGKLL